MGNYKIILLDADVISHFLVSGQLPRLRDFLFPNLLFIVDDVYNEVIRHPSDQDRQTKIDEWIKSSKICRIKFPFTNEKVRLEYYRLKKYQPLLGNGERACMSMARYCKEVIASSNFRDVKEYAEVNGIEYVGCIDILYIAWKRGMLSKDDCNSFIETTIRENKARFPVGRIEDYVPDRDLSYFISANFGENSKILYRK